MRGLLCAISLLSGLVAAAGSAGAGVTIDLLFVERNGLAIAPTDTVAVVPGDTLEMQVRFTNDVPLTGIAISLNYDLDANHELDDVVSAVRWRGASLNKAQSVQFLPLPLAPFGATSTFAGTFSGAVDAPGTTLTLPPGSYQLGTVTWKVDTGVIDDGADIFSGFLFFGVDGLGGSGFLDISNTALFHDATLNLGLPIPEPGTAALLCLALVGLAASGRRHASPRTSRRSASTRSE